MTDIVDIVAEVHAETDKAVLVSLDGNRKAAVWLPLAAIEFERRRKTPSTADIKLTERLATSKGLV